VLASKPSLLRRAIGSRKTCVQVERNFIAAVDELITLADISHPIKSSDGKQRLFSTQNFVDSRRPMTALRR
jgi:hypothetical protein